MAHMLLTGASGTYASMPYAALLNEPSILDVRAEIDLDAYASVQDLVSRWTGAAASSVFRFKVRANGQLQINCRDSAQTDRSATSNANATVSPGTPTQLRTTIDTSAGEVKFYQRAVGSALTDDAGWTQVGATQAFAGANILQPTSAGIQFGAAANGGTLDRADGKYFRGVVKKGAVTAGTLIVDADPSDTSTWDCPDKLLFTEKANSATVTLQGDATLVGDCPSSGNRMGDGRAIRKPPR